ncbi:MAG: hypothetical protein JXR91_14815, partial [Deltaproteobacteria bacterium]|nr:hypothetical protein [Deltaproteobacteria bacterium]
HTGLSKGGIYRFFKNKTEVALALFFECYSSNLDFKVEECLNWNLSIGETIFKMISRYSSPVENARRTDRVWVKLLPEVLNDKRFSETRASLLKEIEVKMLLIAETVAARDGLRMIPEMYSRVPDAIAIGLGLMEGFAIQSALGGPIEHQGILAKEFVTAIVSRFFERDN